MSRVYNVTCWKQPVFTAGREIEADSAEQALAKCGDDWHEDDFEETDRSLGSPVHLRAEAENDEEDSHEIELDPTHLMLMRAKAALNRLVNCMVPDGSDEENLALAEAVAVLSVLPKE